MDQLKGVADLSQSSVSSEQIYAEALPQTNPREEIEAAAAYFKEQYNLLANVCENQKKKIEELSRTQNSEDYELRNEIYELKSQMNSIKEKYLQEIDGLKRQNAAMAFQFEQDLEQHKTEYERHLYDIEEEYRNAIQANGQQPDPQVQHDLNQMADMIEQLQALNQKLEQERADIASRYDRQRVEHSQEQERQRAEFSAQLANLTKTTQSSSDVELRETKRQMDDLLNRYSLLTIENNKLRAERDSLHRALQEKLEDISSLRQQLDIREEQLENKKRELEVVLRRLPSPDESYSKILDESKAEKSGGEKQLEQLHEQISRLRNNYDAEMSVLYQKELELNQGREAINQKQEEINQLLELYEHSKQQQEQSQHELAKLKRLYKQKEDELEQVKKTEETKRLHHKQSTQQSQQHIRKLNQYINQSEAVAEADKAKLLEEVTRLNHELSDREGKMLAMRLELIQTRDAYDSEKGMMSDLKRRLVELQDQQMASSRAEQSRLSRLDGVRSSDSIEVNTDSRNSQYMQELKQSLQRLSRENQKLMKEMEQANANYIRNLEEGEEALEALSSKLQISQKQLESAYRKIDKLQREISQKEADFLAYRSKTETAQRTERASVQQNAGFQLKNATSRLEQMAAQLNEFKRANSDLSYKLAVSTSQLQELAQSQQGRAKELEDLRGKMALKSKDYDAAMRQLDTKSSEYSYCKQLLTTRTMELEETKTRLNLKLLEDEGKTRQSVIRMESMVSQEQLNLKDQQMRILTNQLGFQRELVVRLQSQLAKQKQLAEESSRKQGEIRSEYLRLQSKSVQQTATMDYQKIVDDTSRLNQQLNQEVRRCYQQISELQKQLHEKSMIRNESSIGQSQQMRQLEKVQVDQSRELAQAKLQLSTYVTKERFLEMKLQELRRDKEAMASIAREKRSLEEELKGRNQELQSCQRQRALLEHEADLLKQDSLSKENSIATLRNRLAEYQRTLENLKFQNEELEQLKARASMELTLKTGQVVQYRQQMQNKDASLARLEDTVQKLSWELTQSRQSASQLNRQNEQRRVALDGLRANLNQKLGQIDEWKRQQKHLSRSIESKQNQHQSIRRQLDKKNIELAESNAYCEQLKEEAQKIIDGVRKELADQKYQCELLKEQKFKQERESSNLKETIERRQLHELSRLKEELEMTKKEHSKAQEAKNQLASKIREVSCRLEQTSEALQQALSDKAHLDRLLTEAQHKNRELDARLNEESSTNKRLLNELKQIKQQIGVQQGQYDKLMQQFEYLKGRNVNEVDQLQRTLEDMNNRLVAQKKIYEEKNAERSRDQAAALNRLNSDNNRLETELKGANRENHDLRELITKLKHEKQGVMNELTMTREQKIELEKDAAAKQACMASFEDRIKGLVDEIERLKHENSVMTFRDARFDESMIQAEREKLLEYVVELENKCKTLETNQSNNRSRLAIRYGDNTRVTELQTQVENLKGINKTLEGEINALTKENARLFTQTSSLNNTVLQLKMENQRLSMNTSSHRDTTTIENLQSQLDRVNRVLLDKEEENSRLRSTGTVITKIDYLQPEYVAPSPLNFHSLAPSSSGYFSHIQPTESVKHIRQPSLGEQVAYGSRGGSPSWRNESSHLRYEMQPIPVTNAPLKSYSTLSLTRPY